MDSRLLGNDGNGIGGFRGRGVGWGDLVGVGYYRGRGVGRGEGLLARVTGPGNSRGTA